MSVTALPPSVAEARGAAFFDVDRTLLAGASGLHLAKPLRQRGMLSARQLVRALVIGASFSRGGSDHAQMGRFNDGVRELMRGWSQADFQSVVHDELERRVRPMVFDEALERIEQHRARGERVYAVSATTREIIEPLAELLGLDGAVASRLEVRDGHFTGEIELPNHGPEKAFRLLELAEREGIDLAASSAYSDSITDEEFLRAVGRPYAVNPDKALRALAEEEGWGILRFHTRVRAPLHRRRSTRAGVLALAGGVAIVARRRSRGRRGA